MWRLNFYTLKSIASKSLLVLFCWFFFPLLAFGEGLNVQSTSTVQQAPLMVEVPLKDLTALQTTIKSLRVNLEVAQNTLTEPQKQAMQLNQQIATLKEQQVKLDEELTLAKKNYQNALSLVEKQNSELTELSLNLKQEQAKARLNNYRTGGYCLLIGYALRELTR